MCQCNRSADESPIDGIRQRRGPQPVATFTKPLAENSKFGFDRSGCLFRAREIVQAYWNAELSEAEMDAVDTHTFNCRKCANTVEVYHEAVEQQLALLVIAPVLKSPSRPLAAPHRPALPAPASGARLTNGKPTGGDGSSSTSTPQEDDFRGPRHAPPHAHHHPHALPHAPGMTHPAPICLVSART